MCRKSAHFKIFDLVKMKVYMKNIFWNNKKPRPQIKTVCRQCCLTVTVNVDI